MENPCIKPRSLVFFEGTGEKYHESLLRKHIYNNYNNFEARTYLTSRDWMIQARQGNATSQTVYMSITISNLKMQLLFDQ